MNTHTRRHRPHAFTLIELLTVIAIIGILAAIIIPTVGAVRVSAKKAKTKVQFSQWISAIEMFKQEYGYYPNFGNSLKINGSHIHSATGNIAAANTLFREVLSGKGTGSGSPAAFQSSESVATTAQNKKRLTFYPFTDSDITSTAEGDKSNGAIKDAFGNVEIAILVDKTGDGIIKNAANEDGEIPSLTGNDGKSFTPTTSGSNPDIPSNGVRAGVIIYSAGEKGKGVMSWK